MNSTELRDIEIDFGRVTAGLKRSWWMIVVGALAGLVFAVTAAPNSVLTQSEFSESDARVRFQQHDLTVTPFVSIVDVMDSSRFRDAVDAKNGAPVSFGVTLTPSGQIGFEVSADSSERGDELVELIYVVLDDVIGNRDRMFVQERLDQIDTVIANFEGEIDLIRSVGADQVAELLERSSLVGLLASEQLSKSRLEAVLETGFTPVIEIRRTTTSGSLRNRAAAALLGGALLGAMAAIANSLLRRRVGNLGGLRTVAPNAPNYQIGRSAPDDDATAIIAGAIRRSGNRHADAPHIVALGEVATELLASARVSIPQLGDDASSSRIALIGISTPFADVVATDPHDGVVVVAKSTDSIKDGRGQAARIEAAGIPILAAVLAR